MQNMKAFLVVLMFVFAGLMSAQSGHGLKAEDLVASLKSGKILILFTTLFPKPSFCVLRGDIHGLSMLMADCSNLSESSVAKGTEGLPSWAKGVWAATEPKRRLVFFGIYEDKSAKQDGSKFVPVFYGYKPGNLSSLENSTIGDINSPKIKRLLEEQLYLVRWTRFPNSP